MRTTIATWARRVAAIGRSLPGLLAAAAVLVSAGAPLIVDLLNDVGREIGWTADGATQLVTEWSLRIVAALTMAGNVYRRVTEVGRELWSLDPVRTVTSAVYTEGSEGP